MPRFLGALAFILISVLASAVAHAQSLPDPATRQLAQRPLGLPIAETALGGTILLATPVIAGVIMFSSVKILGCEDWTTGEVDPDCEREEADDRAHSARVALGVGIPLGLIGAALLTHGAYRIRRIKQARRSFRLELGGIELNRQGAAATLRFTF